MRRLCLEPGCPDPPIYRGRCRTHGARRRIRQRHAIYSTKRWTILRRAVLAEHPACQGCGLYLATQVHHVVSLEDGGAPWARDNLEALCISCHSRETRREMDQ